MNSNKRKFFNLRFILFTFVLALLCSFFAVKVCTSIFYIFLFAIPLAYLIYLVITKRYINFALSLAFLLFITCYVGIYVSTYHDYAFAEDKYVVSGKVESTYQYDNYVCVVLSGVILTDEDGNSVNLSHNILSYVYGIDFSNEELIAKHTRIVFPSKITGVDLLENGKINTFILGNRIKHVSVGVSSSKIVNLGEELSFVESIKKYNHDLLIEYFGDYQGEIAYASLYGDKTDFDPNFIYEIKVSGIAHIFTISGLHVGLIVMILAIFLNKSRLKSWLKLLVVAIVLCGFCLMSSFSASVVRASVMSLVMLSGRILKREYDSINALSFAGCIILIFNPMSLYNGGFCMTFACMFGILLIGKQLYRVRIKNKIIKPVYFAMTTTLSAEIGLLPMYAKYGFLPTWSLLSNLVILPLFSIFYTLLFVLNLIVFVLPIVSFVYIIPKAILATIIFLNHLVVALPYNTITIYAFDYAQIFVLFLSMYCLSRLFVVKSSYKVAIAVVCVMFISLSTIIPHVAFLPKENKITYYSQSSSISTLVELKNGRRYIVAPDYTNLAKSLKKESISHLDGIFVLGEIVEDDINLNFEQLKDFTSTLYINSDNPNKAKLSSLGFTIKDLTGEYTLINSDFVAKCVASGDSIASLFIKHNTKTYAFISNINFQNDTTLSITTKEFNHKFDCAKIIGVEQTTMLQDCFDAERFVFDSTPAFSMAF